LPAYINCPIKPRVLVVNSSSSDGTVELARELGAETLIIPRSEFNHGDTRERARLALNTDIVVMATPDAYPTSSDTLCTLIKPLLEGKASIAYARQIAHDGADFFETFPREFNYPADSHIRSIKDAARYGVYTFFCSNSCAAYINKAIDEVDGFPPVLLGEDTVVVSKLLQKGHNIAYVAEAVVKHSHRYSLRQEFQRLFDTGLARTQYRHLLNCPGNDASRGRAFIKEMCLQLLKQHPEKLPYALLQTISKLSGYYLGRRLFNGPTRIKQLLSSQDFYWASKFCQSAISPCVDFDHKA